MRILKLIFSKLRRRSDADLQDAMEMWHQRALENHDEAERLRRALTAILGWRELRCGHGFPVERVEQIARDALFPPEAN